MKRILFLLVHLFFIFISAEVQAQDTLPNFTVEDKGAGRIVVSWSNQYPNLIQLAVQRSYDSLKRFTSVYSSTSPELPVNGFSDKIVPGLKVYYRIFYVMKGGAYYFSASKRPNTGKNAASPMVVVDSKRDQLDEEMLNKLKKKKDEDSVKVYAPDKPFYVKIKDSLFVTLVTEEFFKFRDSIMQNTKDTLFQLSEDTILLGIYIPPFLQRTSEYVFTDKDGYIVIKLTEAGKKQYDLVFLEEDETPVLELKNVKEPLLILDKTNFYHGGWYKFELRENGKIKERNKIFLAKDFSP